MRPKAQGFQLALALAAFGVGVALLACGALWDSLGVIAVPVIAGLVLVDTYLAFFADRTCRRAR